MRGFLHLHDPGAWHRVVVVLLCVQQGKALAGGKTGRVKVSAAVGVVEEDGERVAGDIDRAERKIAAVEGLEGAGEEDPMGVWAVRGGDFDAERW